MADDYKDLFGKNSMKNFGEIAGSVLASRQSSNKRDRKRQRNILLAQFLFNAKESSMQDKVLTQLEDLDNSKSIDISKAKAAYKKGLELETQYNSVMSNPNGVYGHYKTDAESAFNNYLEERGMDATLYDGTNTSANKQKSDFMRNWSNERHGNFMKVYNPKSLSSVESLGTEEEFLKEITDSYTAERRNIMNPKNLSVVHSVLDTVSGGRIGKGRNEKLEENYTRELAEKEAHEEQYIAFTNPVKNVNTIGQNGADIAAYAGVNEKQVLISGKEVDELIEDFNITKEDSLYKPLRKSILSIAENKRSINAVETAIHQGITKQFITEKKFVVDEITAKYAESFDIASRGDDNYTIDRHNEKRDKEIRDTMGVPNANIDILNAARAFASFSTSQSGIDPDSPDGPKLIAAYQKKQMDDYMNKHFADALGLKTLAEIKQQMYPTLALDIATKVSAGDLSTTTAISATRINSDILMRYKNSDVDSEVEVYNYINDILKGNVVENNEWSETTNQYQTQITQMQQDSYTNNIVAQAKYNLDIMTSEYATPGYANP